MTGDIMAYKNPLYDFADRRPVISFLVVPIALHFAATGAYYMLRSLKTGSPIGSVGLKAGEDQKENPLSALGSTTIRKQGGSDLDLVFRATASPRPTGPGTGTYETVMPSPTQTPVRYDAQYHSQAWLDDPNQVQRERAVTQTQIYQEDISVFNGLSGIRKIKR